MARTPRHSSDQELVGQGLANVTSALFGGLPVTGVIVRSSVAVQSGGRTRLAPVTHAVALLAMMLVAAPYVARVPIAGLAGILLFVGQRLVAWHELRTMWRISRFEAAIFVATMLGIVFTDFIDGVMIGLILALVNFAHTQRQLGVNVTAMAMDEPGEVGRLLGANGDALDVAVVRVEGPIFFASHQHLEALASKSTLPNYLIFDLAGVPTIDVTGVETFKGLIERLEARGTRAVLARAPEAVRLRLERAGVASHALGGTVFPTVARALAAVAAHEETRESPPPVTPPGSADAPTPQPATA
jgi:SulP family sulfate permease